MLRTAIFIMLYSVLQLRGASNADTVPPHSPVRCAVRPGARDGHSGCSRSAAGRIRPPARGLLHAPAVLISDSESGGCDLAIGGAQAQTQAGVQAPPLPVMVSLNSYLI